RVADEAVALVGEGDDAGRQPVTLLVGDDLHLAAFHDGHHRVRRAEVDPDNRFTLCHRYAPFWTTTHRTGAGRGESFVSEGPPRCPRFMFVASSWGVGREGARKYQAAPLPRRVDVVIATKSDAYGRKKDSRWR